MSLKKAGLTLDLYVVAFALWVWCVRRHIWLTASYLPGKLNTVADTKSRVFDYNTEWMLDPVMFKHIIDTFKVQPDDHPGITTS